MASFDYASDIAPIKGNYFSDLSASPMSDREKSYLSQKYMTEISPVLKAQNENLASMNRAASEQLSFQRALTEFQSETLKLQQERDAADKIGGLTTMLEEKFNSGAKPTDLLIDLTKIQAQDPMMFKTSIGSATLDAYKARASALAADEREAKSMNYNLVQQLTPYDPQMANDLASGKVTPEAARFKLVDLATKKSQREADAETKSKRSETALKIQSDFIKDIRAQYNAPEYVGTAEQEYATTKLGGEVGGKAPTAPPAQPLPNSGKLFKPTQRSTYVRNLAMLTGKDQKEVEKNFANDLDLYKALGNKLDEEDTAIYRYSSGQTYGSPVPNISNVELSEVDRIQKLSGLK